MLLRPNNCCWSLKRQKPPVRNKLHSRSRVHPALSVSVHLESTKLFSSKPSEKLQKDFWNVKKPDYSWRTDTISKHFYHTPLPSPRSVATALNISRLAFPVSSLKVCWEFQVSEREQADTVEDSTLCFSSEGLLFHCDLVDLYIVRWDCKEVVGENERETGEKKREGERGMRLMIGLNFFQTVASFSLMQ